jgi:hypothetical protein
LKLSEDNFTGAVTVAEALVTAVTAFAFERVKYAS